MTKMVNTLVVQPDGTMFQTEFVGFDSYRQFLEGDIEALYGDKFMVYFSADGKFKRMRPNEGMTSYLQEKGILSPNDWIAGPVVVLGLPDRNGEETELSFNEYTQIMSEVFAHIAWINQYYRERFDSIVKEYR